MEKGNEDRKIGARHARKVCGWYRRGDCACPWLSGTLTSSFLLYVVFAKLSKHHAGKKMMD